MRWLFTSPAIIRSARVFTPVYLCRRWDDNSDAALDIDKDQLQHL